MTEAAATVRAPSSEELARVAAARSTLRGTTRWTRLVAFGLPAGISLIVVATTLASYPDGPAGKLLAILLAVGVSFGVFTAPMLLTGYGRPLSVERALARDLEAGPRVERIRGEVIWSRRARSYGAVAGGRTLVSPEFTAYSAIPAFWHHFERLSPGSYLFDVLPASGLVLAAERLSDLKEGERSGDAALREAFDSSLDDVIENRLGRATAAQRWRLLLRMWWLFLTLPFFSLSSWMAARGAAAKPGGGTALGLLGALGVTAFVLWLGGQVTADLVLGKVEVATGRVSFTYGKTEASGWVGGACFTLSNARARVFSPDATYRVFIFRRSRYVVGAEIAQAATARW